MRHRYETVWLVVILIFALTCVLSAIPGRPAHAQGQNDAVSVTPLEAGHGKIALNITAGASGAPGGFTVYWMKLSDYEARGGQWAPAGTPGQMQADFSGVPTLNTDGGQFTTFELAPNQTITVEIGDLFDETGVATNAPSELDAGVTYVACGFANASGENARSAYSSSVAASTMVPGGCTYTQGYWKNHPDAWLVTSLVLGVTSYTKVELLSILGTPAGGNGLIALAHQLIAAKLNIVGGADPSAAAAAITAADALIGGLIVPPVGGGYLAPSSTSDLTQTLDDYNNGITGPGHCGETPALRTTWGRIKDLYR